MSAAAAQLLAAAVHGAYEPTASGEVGALRAFYAATNGASWRASSSKNWLVGDPCGQGPYWCGEGCSGWQGVLCWGPGGHVRKLRKGDLTQGVLPTQIGLLTGLAALDLARSHGGGGARAPRGQGLSGTLPSELGRLPFRSTDADSSGLLLSGHRISGSLPPSLAFLPDDLVRCSLPSEVGCSPAVAGWPKKCTPTAGGRTGAKWRRAGVEAAAAAGTTGAAAAAAEAMQGAETRPAKR